MHKTFWKHFGKYNLEQCTCENIARGTTDTGHWFHKLSKSFSYSVPYAILQLLEELFSRPWLSLESPRFHRSLDMVSRCPHKIFSALRPKKWPFETEQQSPPIRSPEVGELLSHFEKCKYLYSDFSECISQNGTIYFFIVCLQKYIVPFWEIHTEKSEYKYLHFSKWLSSSPTSGERRGGGLLLCLKWPLFWP